MRLLHFYNPVIIFVTFLILALILFEGNRLRSIGYERVPNIGIFDERSYVWQGISLRKHGIPVGWSNLEVYEKSDENVFKTVRLNGFTININNEDADLNSFNHLPKPVIVVNQDDFGFGTRDQRYVIPFIDHPPLGGLFYSLGVSDKAKTFSDISPDQFRNMTLPLGILTTVLLFIYALGITKNIWIGLISAIIYSTVPTYLFASRFALLENVLAAVALVHLNLLLVSKKLFEKNHKLKILPLILSSVFGGLAILTKESGSGFIIGSVILMIVWRYPRRYIAIFTLIITFMVGLYLVWCFWLSPTVAYGVFIQNTTRGFYGALNFLSQLPGLRFENFPLDGWWIFGLFSVLILSINSYKKYFPLLIPFGTHLLVILLFAGLSYPWYYLALIPFIIISTAIVLWSILTSPSLPLIILFFLLPLSSSFYWGRTVFNLPASTWEYRLLLIFILTISTVRLLQPNKKVIYGWYGVCIALFILITKLNIQSITYLISHWSNLPIPPLPHL